MPQLLDAEAAARKTLATRRKPGFIVSSLGPFNQKKTQHFPRGITAEVHPSWPQTFPDHFG